MSGGRLTVDEVVRETPGKMLDGPKGESIDSQQVEYLTPGLCAQLLGMIRRGVRVGF